MSHANPISPLPERAADFGLRRRIARALRWAAATMATAAILVALSVPSGLLWIPDLPNVDKLLHTVIFVPLMILWCVATRAQWPQLGRAKLVLAVGLLVTLYGVYGEIHQKYFTKGRSFSFWDMIFNMIGVVLGAAAWWWWQRRRDFSEATVAEPELPPSPL